MSVAQVVGFLSALGGIGGLAAFFYVLPKSREFNARARKLNVEADSLVAQSERETHDRVRSDLKVATRRLKRCTRLRRAHEEYEDQLRTVIRALGTNPPEFFGPKDPD